MCNMFLPFFALDPTGSVLRFALTRFCHDSSSGFPNSSIAQRLSGTLVVQFAVPSAAQASSNFSVRYLNVFLEIDQIVYKKMTK